MTTTEEDYDSGSDQNLLDDVEEEEEFYEEENYEFPESELGAISLVSPTEDGNQSRAFLADIQNNNNDLANNNNENDDGTNEHHVGDVEGEYVYRSPSRIEQLNLQQHLQRRQVNTVNMGQLNLATRFSTVDAMINERDMEMMEKRLENLEHPKEEEHFQWTDNVDHPFRYNVQNYHTELRTHADTTEADPYYYPNPLDEGP